ncbi:MAG TPA: FAD-dependent oxidoreductase [Acidimicrobiales bacterium]|nr:FAD-dependent oxidoreductase [Acidimicrobiales bacterium]
MERVVIVGGGVGGLSAALAFGRQGHEVTLLERDPLPPTASAEDAFASERRGAPQAHQTHGFLARIAVVLRERFPDVLDDLFGVGCTVLPLTTNLGEPMPGDEDLRVLVVRRTTFEWVLRNAALQQDHVNIRTGVGIDGVTMSSPGVVNGVHLDTGERVEGDFVIASTGRRGDVPGWLGAHGIDVPETIRESGLMYLTRWYRLPTGYEVDMAKLGGDLGFVKYLAVPGDGDTLSITLAIRPDDKDLRATLSHDDNFEAACRALPGPSQFFERGGLEPCGGVRPMTGLLNRLRRFTDDAGEPSVLGFHAIGDAHTCTNPLYGRGCSLAMVQAVLLADATAAHPHDARQRAIAYETACKREVEPWYDVSVESDKAGSDPAGFAIGSEGGDPGRMKGLAALFIAAQNDPILGRGMARFWNLLATPAEMFGDGELLTRMAEVMANPDAYPIPPREGPTREQLLNTLEAV